MGISAFLRDVVFSYGIFSMKITLPSRELAIKLGREHHGLSILNRKTIALLETFAATMYTAPWRAT